MSVFKGAWHQHLLSKGGSEFKLSVKQLFIHPTLATLRGTRPTAVSIIFIIPT